MSETSMEIIDDEREVKERGISFRVSEEVYEQIESQARTTAKRPAAGAAKSSSAKRRKTAG
jgi:hypothetical protein